MGPCAQANSDHQGAVWGFYGVWRKWDFQRARLCTRALLHSQLHPETRMLPLHFCTLMEVAASRNTDESQSRPRKHEITIIMTDYVYNLSLIFFSKQNVLKKKFFSHSSLSFQLKHVALTSLLMIIIIAYDSNCSDWSFQRE